MIRIIYFSLLSLALLSCNGEGQQAANQFADPIAQQIYQYQDRRQADSLYPYFSHELAKYRQLAVLAFASLQDSTAIERLATLLKDQNADVRGAAAYSLGQLRMPKVFPYLKEAFEKESVNGAKTWELEAIGKCASPESASFLANLPVNTDNAYGLALGLARASTGGRATAAGLVLATALLGDDYPDSVRLYASSYPLRNEKLDMKPVADAWIKALQQDESPFVRSNCAKAIGQKEWLEVLRPLLESARNDANSLVRIGAWQALANIGGDSVLAAAFLGANDSDPLVALTAAETLAKLATIKDTMNLTDAISQIPHWRSQIILIGAGIKLHSTIARDLALTKLKESVNVYEQGAILQAMALQPENFSYIKERLYRTSESIVLRSYAAESMALLAGSASLESASKKMPNLKKDLAEAFKYAIESGDVALVYHGSLALADDESGIRKYITDFSFLKKAQEKLPLPRDIEAYQELQKLIDKIEGKKTPTSLPTFKENSINWAWASKIPSTAKLVVTTSKGVFKMQLLVNEAPGTVAEITKLVQDGFYNGKNFHRVVPNFVAQGGCPRGDGTGGLSYTIRSEFGPLRYGEGSVGMASAGKDTESCQWFITHSPTPRLDGRYTIFAKVIEGMEVVNTLDIGDVIEDIRLQFESHK